MSMRGVTPTPKSFLGQPAPAGYVPGLGRGATGFTTRPDIGPARDGPMTPLDPLLKDIPIADGENGADDGGDRKYEENEEGLLAPTGPYTADDAEADRIFAAVDARMEERRNRHGQDLTSARPKTQAMFADLKQDLRMVTDDEWTNLPEAGDWTSRKKRKKEESERERYTPVPDQVVLASTGLGIGGSTATASHGTKTDFKQISDAKEMVLRSKLDQAERASGILGSQTSIDPTGYMTGLESQQIRSLAELADLRKARLILKSSLQADRANPSAWIALARLEKHAGEYSQARKIITEACNECPSSEDVWLEAINIIDDRSKHAAILADALRQLPLSVNLWIQAAELETDPSKRKAILRKGIEAVPNSVKLWKALIELETDREEARVLLVSATECAPSSVELWLALARLESHDGARKVLNRARKELPASPDIWIAAARLEEAYGHDKMVEMLIQRGLASLNAQGVSLSREQWLDEACKCEETGDIQTCEAIVKATLLLGVEDEDHKRTYLEDAERMLLTGFVNAARAIYAKALLELPFKKSIWLKAAELEKKYGAPAALDALLKRAVEACPKAEPLWLMLANAKTDAGDTRSARTILAEAFANLPNSEAIWLSAAKLEQDQGEMERARIILKRARELAGTPRIWLKAIVFERQQGQAQEALHLAKDGIVQFGDVEKLWIVYAQLEERLNGPDAMKEILSRAVRACPKSATLWILAARLEEKQGLVPRARALLDNARLSSPNNPTLWLEMIRLERRAGQVAAARSLMGKALRKCGTNGGELWLEAVRMEPRPLKKACAADAVAKAGVTPWTMAATAELMAADGKFGHAAEYWERALAATGGSLIGDIWAMYYKMLREQMSIVENNDHVSGEKTELLLTRAEEAKPRYGASWQRINKADEMMRHTFREKFLALVSQI